MKRILITLLFLLPFVLLSQNQSKAVFEEVIANDNLTKIASRNNATIDSLKKWNPGVIPTSLPIGKRIIVGWEEVALEEVGGDSAVSEQSNEQQSVSASSAEEQSQRKAETSDNKKHKKEREKAPNSQEPKNNHFSWGTLLVGLILGTVLGILLLYFFFVKKLKANHERDERDLSQRIAELRDEKTKLTSEVSRLRTKSN